MGNKRTALGAFLVGAIAASLLTHYFYTQKIKEQDIANDCSFELVISEHDLFRTLHILKALRSGNVTNFFDECERSLDSSVVGVASMSTELPKMYPFLTNDYVFEQHRAIDTSIKDAKKYREKFPYQNDDQITGGRVAAAFALVNVQTNH